MLENNLIQQIELLQKNLDFLRVLHQEAQRNWEHAQQLATPVTQLLKDEQFSDAAERSEKSIVALERAKEALEKIASSEKLSNEAKVEAQQAGLLHVEVLAMLEQLRPLAQRAALCRDALQNYGDGLTEALQQNNWVLAVEYAQQALVIAPNSLFWREKHTEAQEQLHKTVAIKPFSLSGLGARRWLRIGLLVFVLLIVASALFVFFWLQSATPFTPPTSQPISTITAQLDRVQMILSI